MRSTLLSFIALLGLVPQFASVSFAQASQPTAAVRSTPDTPPLPSIYIEAQDQFASAITAAIIKKRVPATVVTEQQGAKYTLKSADVFAKPESTGSKVARCLFAYCAGIEGTASVSVQLIRNADNGVVWAYQVRKGNSGPVGVQSLSEAIAKHLKNDYLDKQK